MLLFQTVHGHSQRKPKPASDRQNQLDADFQVPTNNSQTQQCGPSVVHRKQSCVLLPSSCPETPCRECEHILNQIRERVQKIEKLMAQLEEPHRTRLRPSPRIRSSSALQSSSSMNRSLPVFPNPPYSSYTINAETNEAVWLVQGRDRLAKFSGLIGAGAH